MTLFTADGLHKLARTWTGRQAIIENPTIEEFSSQIQLLLRSVGDEASEGYWASIARPLRALRWRLATVPLPVNSRAIDVQAVADAVLPRLRRAPEVAPDHSQLALTVADTLEHLWACGDDPLGDAVSGQIWRREGAAILLVDGRHAGAVGEAFPGTPVLTAAELSRTTASDVVAVGPSAWFPSRVLRAPRAERFVFVRFGWLRDRGPELDLVDGSEKRVRQALEEAPAREPRPGRSLVDAADVVPRIEWSAVTRAARHSDVEGWGEPVEAALFVLASGQGVYFESRDGARANVAEVDEELLVHQSLVSELVPGDFLVVRTEGDENYVRNYADRLLGTEAAHLRRLQQRLKGALNAELNEAGVALVARKLRRLGSTIASEANVRRWADPTSIKTRDYSDFAAICSLVGEANAEALWDAMGKIAKAHTKAGNEIRRLLLAELQEANLTTLLQNGWDDYEVEEIDGEGTLRVARITGRAPDLAAVPRSRLRRVFEIEGDLWLG
ncbi:hypothetical protein DVA67_020570 [Solirubrobacter sp. CPCC 204708]|uniref:Uncharacterized protein n=1 Tax=Solirubrobacter deserti TaxID=2282478 RepID=A0ABT4RNE1_9ACTN|nr:hypothetical protein [Solirubrobacter deserti]MBE2318388.1 hypothetical protein [Solirubrobacter deserti]MDA0140093.1 hypothetical protein [Solirubrobacter deserti]